eukprot:GHRR01032933.1.p1 GENE.GHRR01032933.1~~GHRR01032933.1.p1  ORF type:complete len:179 (+),score=26.42 GHRR01032933.1:319-855(+)
MAKFGSAPRTGKLLEQTWQLLGRASLGATTGLTSAFGKQANGRCKTEPAFKVSQTERFSAGSAKHVTQCPGPDAYNIPTDTIGNRLTSARHVSAPVCRIGTEQRWSVINRPQTLRRSQPMLGNSKLSAGSLGDAPSWSFHGPRQRPPLTAGTSGCPLAPTSAARRALKVFSPCCQWCL